MCALRTTWKKDFPIISDEDIRKFAETIEDTNPIHHDNEAAAKAGLRGIIAPGVMMFGYVSAAIAEEIPGVLLVYLKEMVFKRPLYAGASPSVLCEVTEQDARYAGVDCTLMNGPELVMKVSNVRLKLPR